MAQTYNTQEITHFVAVPGDHHIWNAHDCEESAIETVEALKKEYPDRPYEVMTDLDAFHDAAQAKFLTPVERSNRVEFWNFLEMLPPLGWRTHNGIERFCMSEFTFGGVTTQFARMNHEGRDIYARKPVLYHDSSTFITADEIRRTNMVFAK